MSRLVYKYHRRIVDDVNDVYLCVASWIPTDGSLS